MLEIRDLEGSLNKKAKIWKICKVKIDMADWKKFIPYRNQFCKYTSGVRIGAIIYTFCPKNFTR